MKRKWWHEKVAYQIYPKSFYDTNGDGVGDIRGIINKLDYLQDLGVEIVWISPMYQSPFVDQGYDISDYYAIDPVFGNLGDMEELIAEAKKRNINIVMDLVVNHCSDQHEWFQKAIADPYGKYGKYFYIKEGKNGNPPCNWRGYFGGSAWDKLPGHENLYYLHMFAKEQPDLNWENEEVRQEIYKMICWWLEKGIAGFRLDAIINIKKELNFKDYPADREDGLCSPFHMLEEANGVLDFLNEMKRESFAKYDAFTIGELFDYKPEELEAYVGNEGCFESIFDFSTCLIGADPKGWFARKEVEPDTYRDTIFASKEKSQDIAFVANIIENHDEPRGVSRYIPEGEMAETSKKMLAGITMMTYGLPFLYQGQEIGMTNKKFKSISEVNDINTIDEYQVALANGLTEEEALTVISKMSRDNARSPMQWDDSQNAGFTEGTPWLAVNENYSEINVKKQKEREDSLFHFYKELIALRKNPEYKETIVYGKQLPFRQEDTRLMAFYRKSEEKTLLVLANYQNMPRKLMLPLEIKRVLINNYNEVKQEEKELYLEGYQFLVIEL